MEDHTSKKLLYCKWSKLFTTPPSLPAIQLVYTFALQRPQFYQKGIQCEKTSTDLRQLGESENWGKRKCVSLTSVTAMAPHCSATLRRLSPTFAKTVTCTQGISDNLSLAAMLYKLYSYGSTGRRFEFITSKVALFRSRCQPNKLRVIYTMHFLEDSYHLTSLDFRSSYGYFLNPKPERFQRNLLTVADPVVKFTETSSPRSALHAHNIGKFTTRIHRTRADYANLDNYLYQSELGNIENSSTQSHVLQE